MAKLIAIDISIVIIKISSIIVSFICLTKIIIQVRFLTKLNYLYLNLQTSAREKLPRFLLINFAQ